MYLGVKGYKIKNDICKLDKVNYTRKSGRTKLWALKVFSGVFFFFLISGLTGLIFCPHICMGIAEMAEDSGKEVLEQNARNRWRYSFVYWFDCGDSAFNGADEPG